MAVLKTKEEIELMKKSGRICSLALAQVLKRVKAGVSCKELDDCARESILEQGGKLSFVTVDDYKWAICTTINQQVVHGIPTDRRLVEGDVLGIDIGAVYEGYHSDMAISVPIGKVSADIQSFLDVGRNTLKEAISMVKVGNTIGDVSSTIQQGVESAGYSVVKNLTGHGVGTALHEDPIIPCFGKAGKGQVIQKNMTLAIEVIYAKGAGEVILEEDNWTISTKDNSLGGLFEQTVVVTDREPIIMTPYL